MKAVVLLQALRIRHRDVFCACVLWIVVMGVGLVAGTAAGGARVMQPWCTMSFSGGIEVKSCGTLESRVQQ